jgi:hypothetical protein
MNESCETCRFWRQSDNVTGLISRNIRDTEPNRGGYCRRDAPKANGYFPSTAHWDWCGEFEPRLTPTSV